MLPLHADAARSGTGKVPGRPQRSILSARRWAALLATLVALFLAKGLLLPGPGAAAPRAVQFAGGSDGLADARDARAATAPPRTVPPRTTPAPPRDVIHRRATDADEAERLTELRADPRYPLVFMEVEMGGEPLGRMEFALFPDVAPR